MFRIRQHIIGFQVQNRQNIEKQVRILRERERGREEERERERERERGRERERENHCHLLSCLPDELTCLILLP